MSYVRTCMKENYFRVHRKDFNLNKVFLTQLVDIEFEQVCLKQYFKILMFWKNVFEQETTLEQDLELLRASREGGFELPEGMQLTEAQMFAVILRSERKKIIRSQIDLVAYLQKVLRESFQLKSMASANAPQKDLDRAFQSIYLQLSQAEKDDVDQTGNFKSEEAESEYQNKRFCLRHYLKSVFELQTVGYTEYT